MELQSCDSGGAGLVELASGIDALYCSGRAAVPGEFLDVLERAREEAEETGRDVPVPVGDTEFRVQDHGLSKYRYHLTHVHGIVGVSPSTKLPALRIQPRASFLHGRGAREAIDWFRQAFEVECGPVLLTTSRIDLHSDWQGWALTGDDRRNFLCRSEARVTHERGDLLSGFQFGKRRTKTLSGRIYDKTMEIHRSGADYWEAIWGEQFDREMPVLRVEFEFGRQALAQFDIRSPEEAIDAAGALWSYASGEWLSLRTPTADATKSRWPEAPEWQRIRRARMADSALGMERVYDGRRDGTFRLLVPMLVGYLVRYAAVFGIDTVEETCGRLVEVVRGSCLSRGLSFEKRVMAKRRELGFPCP
jgi:hypothetical protein